MMKLLNLILVIIIINYLNTKKITSLPKMLTAKRQKFNNSKVISINDNSDKSPQFKI